MQRSLLSMEGMPVLSEEGVRLGAISDAHFDPFEQRIVGFAVDWENDLVRGPEDMLPIIQISELNADIVTIPEMAATAGLDYMRDTDADGLLLVRERLAGLKVVSEKEPIGELVDLLFDPQDGSVTSYEIAPADNGDTTRPSYLLPPRPDLDFQGDRLVLSEAAQADLKHKTGQDIGSLGIAFLEVEDEADQVGEEDIEVTRSQRTQPY